MKYASFGSISTGTLRTEDLLDAFASELEHHVQRNADEWCSDEGRARRDECLALVGEAREVEDGSSHAADEIVCALEERLQDFAPPYAYFGAHPGDGSDFGYWVSESIADDFDGLKVSDTSEVPADYCGEVLHVNDHGNCTLYAANNGELTEVWSVV